MLIATHCKINVFERGRGVPVLMLHGNPDSGSMWLPVMEALGDGYRCIAVDLPGFAGSVADDAFDYSLTGQVSFLSELIAAIGVDKIHLVGYDFGGTFAGAYLASHPDRVASAILSNSIFFPDYRWHLWARVWRTPWLGELSMAVMKRPLFHIAMRRASPMLPDAYIDDAFNHLTSEGKTAVLRLYRAVPPAAFRDWEPRLLAAADKVPVMVLWGEPDPYVPDRFASRFNAWRVKRFPAAGHWLPVVEPEAFAAEMHKFYTEIGAAPVRPPDSTPG